MTENRSAEEVAGESGAPWWKRHELMLEVGHHDTSATGNCSCRCWSIGVSGPQAAHRTRLLHVEHASSFTAGAAARQREVDRLREALVVAWTCLDQNDDYDVETMDALNAARNALEDTGGFMNGLAEGLRP